jgi:hypothetical protein
MTNFCNSKKQIDRLASQFRSLQKKLTSSEKKMCVCKITFVSNISLQYMPVICKELYVEEVLNEKYVKTPTINFVIERENSKCLAISKELLLNAVNGFSLIAQSLCFFLSKYLK